MTDSLSLAADVPAATASPAEDGYPRGRAAAAVGGDSLTPSISVSLRLHGRMPHEVVANLARAVPRQRREDRLHPPGNASSSLSPVSAEGHAGSALNVSGRSRSAESISYTRTSEGPDECNAGEGLTLGKTTMFSFSEGGDRIACAAGNQFFVLSPKERQPSRRADNGSPTSAMVMEIVGQGSGCLEDGETITAISCLPLFVPPSARASTENAVFIAVGYSTGWFRIYNQTGALLISQLLHTAPLTAIKLRTLWPARSETCLDANSAYDEEVMLLYQDGRVVAAEGGSLWIAIRAVDRHLQYDFGGGGSSEFPISTNQESASFAYKKWYFNSDEVTDVISCGPARISPALALPIHPPTVPSSLLSTTATARYIVVGMNPMVSYHATTDKSRPLLSTVSLASVVASATRVTSAVLGFAKSWWGGGGDSEGDSTTSGSSGCSPTFPKGYTAAAATATAPATPMPSLTSLTDSGRKVLRVTLAPKLDRASQLAACVDSLGRVTLLDVDECELVRMWKGMRGAQCAWVLSTSGAQRTPGPVRRPGKLGARRMTPQEASGVVTSVPSVPSSPPTASGHPAATSTPKLFLAVYAPKRGHLEVWRVRHGCRVASRAIGHGCFLANVVDGRVGAGMILAADEGKGLHGERGKKGASEDCCFIVGPAGEVWVLEVETPQDVALPSPAPSKAPGRLGAVRKKPASPSGIMTMVATEAANEPHPGPVEGRNGHGEKRPADD